MRPDADIVIIGGGVAGLSAAIAAQGAGLRSVLIERNSTPTETAGETMHPGIAPIVGKLGILGAFEDASTGRFPGIKIRSEKGDERFEAFGDTCGEPWLGYHIPRQHLAKLLHVRAEESGCHLAFGRKATRIGSDKQDRMVVASDAGPITTHWILDATGTFGFSVRRDGTGHHRASGKRVVAYSYRREEPRDSDASCIPTLQFESWGWTWEAPLGNGVTACVDLYVDGQAIEDRRSCHSGKLRYADGHWVVARKPSYQRVFRIGDAAMRLDPSSGKGVLRAMMTAIMTIHLVTGMRRNILPLATANSCYNNWVRRWFSHDAKVLSQSASI